MIKENQIGTKKISVIIPCRNEKKFIRQTLDSLLAQTLPIEDYEIIVVDGLSDDGTIDILNEYCRVNLNVRLIHNEKKITPSAMNLGIKNSIGEIIVICGAHSFYSSDFLSSGIDLMTTYPEYGCVGGPITSEGDNNFSKATAIAMSSIIGVGNAKHRFPDYEGLAEMACFPFFRKEIFSIIGYYNEQLVRNQDDEFCLRYREKGGKVFISHKVKSTYFVRSSPFALIKQYFNYGYWRWILIRMYKMPISIRQLIPSIFILILLLLLTYAIIMDFYFLLLIFIATYLTSLFIFAMKIFFDKGIIIGINFVFSVIILHFSYGLGLFYSIFEQILFKRIKRIFL
jgi:succinoglycan biosynthesis protein ExoA